MKTVFIDGQHGTTGLKITDRLAARRDLELVRIADHQRKDPDARRRLLNSADFVILCLPDDAARESVGLIENPAVRVLDASSAHRTAKGWVYGIPELDAEHRARIAAATRLSVPGCYPTGFVLALRPLVAAGMVPPEYPVTTYAITGYSGGGRSMIEDFQQAGDTADIAARPKNLSLTHKHLPEMRTYALLARPPIFVPIVANVLQGMLVFVPLFRDLLRGGASAEAVRRCLADHYQGQRFVRVASRQESEAVGDGFLSPTACNDTNNLEIFVFEKEERILLVARLDNLGKGASGAAVQNLNLMLGADEGTGLDQPPL
jgi:N-acetyl-gamma-glutamyl-phosphate reductase